MVSSVAIDGELRRKLKLLAAKYDTTQAEIIRRAIELLESSTNLTSHSISSRVNDELKKATKSLHKKNPRRKKIATALSERGIDIDDLRIVFGE